MAYNYGYNGENLYLGIPEPDIYAPEPEGDPDDEYYRDEDRYLFPPLWLAGLMKKEGE